MRLAADATPQDVQQGRKLFFGETRLTGGAVACVFCHTAAEGDAARRQPRSGSQRRLHTLSRLGARSEVATPLRAGRRRSRPPASPRRNRWRFARFSLGQHGLIRSQRSGSGGRHPRADEAITHSSPSLRSSPSLLMVVAAALRVVYDTSVECAAASVVCGGASVAGTNLLRDDRCARCAARPPGDGGMAGPAVDDGIASLIPADRVRGSRSSRSALPRLVGAVAAVRRRVLQRTANRASLVDAAFLGTWLLTLLSGLAIAIVYRWATAWSAVTVTPYARSLLSLQPNVARLEAMPYLVKLHIFSSFIVVALLAFTRMLDVLLSAAGPRDRRGRRPVRVGRRSSVEAATGAGPPKRPKPDMAGGRRLTVRPPRC